VYMCKSTDGHCKYEVIEGWRHRYDPRPSSCVASDDVSPV